LLQKTLATNDSSKSKSLTELRSRKERTDLLKKSAFLFEFHRVKI